MEGLFDHIKCDLIIARCKPTTSCVKVRHSPLKSYHGGLEQRNGLCLLSNKVVSTMLT